MEEMMSLIFKIQISFNLNIFLRSIKCLLQSYKTCIDVWIEKVLRWKMNLSHFYTFRKQELSLGHIYSLTLKDEMVAIKD